MRARISPILSQYWGYSELRPLQLEAIAAGIAHRDSLVVLPTGGGKSLCYQLPPLITGRLTVVVSPLIALMKDQVDGLSLANYPAAAIHSGIDQTEMIRIRRETVSGRIRLLLVAPERIIAPSFLSFLRDASVGSFAIDEAHCISQWGHDFRPEYRRLRELREAFPALALHAYTATATPRVRQDILEQLELREPEVLVGCFDRPNLTYRVVPRVDGRVQVEQVLRRHSGQAAIVYCISRRETESLAEALSARGLPARAYHAGLPTSIRHEVQDDFANERLNIVVATVAFGMGIDRSDVRCIIHASMPKSVEHYQQETGRAGRDGLASECVLLYSAADPMKWRQLMARAAADADPPVAPEAESAQLELLDHMQRHALAARCRHKALSAYFGQELGGESCGACDVCLGELKAAPDAGTIARKIISCVARLQHHSGTGFGAAYVADVLRGADSARITARGHQHLSTFGILASIEKERLASYINQLIDAEALARRGTEYPVVTLSSRSAAILRGDEDVSLLDPVVTVVERRSRQGGAAADLTVVERQLFEALRLLRRDIARAAGVPPYLVFSDATLEDLSRRRPSNLQSLRAVKGVGEAKRREFGAAFLAAVQKFCAEHDLPQDRDTTPSLRPERAAKPERRPPSEARVAASALFAKGAAIAEVANTIDRALSTTEQYLAEWILEAKPASIAPWVSQDVQARVTKAAEAVKVPQLKAVFDHLSGQVPYVQIRLTLVHRRTLTESGGTHS